MTTYEADRMIRKSQPTSSAVHTDRPLTNMSLAIMQDSSAFIAGQVFPDISVTKQSDLYRTYPEAAFNRDQMRKRAPGTETAGVGYETSTSPYYCDVWGLHHDIDEQTEENADEEVDLDFEATTLLTSQALINRERQWAQNFFQSTSSWTNSVDQAQGWDSGGSDAVLEVIEEASLAMLARSGKRPNTMVLGPEVWSVLKNDPDLLDRINRGQTDGAAQVLRSTLAGLVEIPRIFVAESIYDSSEEGGSSNPGFAFGKHCLLMHVAPSPGRYTASAGYTFSWRGLSGSSAAGTRISRHDMPLTRSRRIEIESAYAQVKIADTLGTMLYDCVS